LAYLPGAHPPGLNFRSTAYAEFINPVRGGTGRDELILLPPVPGIRDSGLEMEYVQKKLDDLIESGHDKIFIFLVNYS